MHPLSVKRLFKERRSLHSSPLPPNYLHPATTSASSDDTTQFDVLLAGPEGTAYAGGLWKLHFKMPEDYPAAPPRASFRTRIWHPNVEENTGAVCVDTLKRDWSPEVTLRDILVVISCLLIQPNPDSALNASAGQLLQEDYEAFARQARLMTSIHALVPADMKLDVAKATGVDPDRMPQTQDLTGPRKRKLPTSRLARSQESQQRPFQQRENLQLGSIAGAEDSDEEFSEENASKENDPGLSPSPVGQPPPGPRKGHVLGKRPLSDLPTPPDPDMEEESLCSSEQNIANNRQPEMHKRKSSKTSLSRGVESMRRPPLVIPKGFMNPLASGCVPRGTANVIKPRMGLRRL